jgi:hypothetical protein
MGEWRDIESAPKDGKRSRVDLWLVRLSSSGKTHDEHRLPDCYWDERLGQWRSPWLRAEGHKPIPPHYAPTHWMPLPAPPQ